MHRTMTLRPGMLTTCAGRACALALSAVLVAPAVAQDRNPFKPAPPAGGGDGVQVSEYLTVDLHVQDEDLGNVLQMLSIQSERNIVMSSKVSARVTADLYNVTFYEALEAILNVNGYGFIERGTFIYVYTLEEIQQIERANRRPISKVVRLDYLNANDAAEFCAPLLSEVGQIKTNGDVGLFNVPNSTPVGDEQFALSATLVIFDYPEHVEEIEKLVKQIDTRPAQVLVEATILQTALTEANAFGVDFSFLNDVNFTDFINVGGPLGAANALIRGGTGAEGDGFSPPDNRGIAGGTSVGNTSGPGGFKLGIIEDDFSLFVRLLDEVSDTVVLSNPKILAVNRAPSRVLVGRRIGFLNTTSTETSTTQSVEFLDTGTQLSFRPFISTNGDIRMELNPSVSEGVIRQATDGNGANVTIPDEITQELTTNVIVRDGSTIVLGGLFKETTVVGRRQVPFVGDLPIIGAAFRGHDDSTDRSEIIFMITPTIMNDERLIEDGEFASDEIRRVRTGTRNGLLPWSRDRMTSKLNLEAERLAAEGETSRALWKLRRSLNMQQGQPEAIDLRERLLGETQSWPSRSMFERVMNRALGVSEPIGSAPTDPSESPRKPLAHTADAQKSAVSDGNAAIDQAQVSEIDGSPDAMQAQPGAGDAPQQKHTGLHADEMSDLMLTVTMTPSDPAAPAAESSIAPSTTEPTAMPDAALTMWPMSVAPQQADSNLIDPKDLFHVESVAEAMDAGGDLEWSFPARTFAEWIRPLDLQADPLLNTPERTEPAPEWLENPRLLVGGVESNTQPKQARTPMWPMESMFLVGDGPIPPRYDGATISSGWRSLRDILKMSDKPLRLFDDRPASDQPAVADVDPDKN